MRKTFSVIMPVFKESGIINKTIEHVWQTASGFDTELIIVDGDITGDTVKTIRNKQAIPMITAKGRGRQMNKGASAASGETLLFLHADTELPANAFEAVSSLLDLGEYAGGAFALGIGSGTGCSEASKTWFLFGTRLTGIPYGDQAIFAEETVSKRCGDSRKYRSWRMLHS